MLQENALAKRMYSRTGGAAMTEDLGLNEREAIIAVQKGNRKAYRLVVERYMKQAYYIALGFVHNQDDALDVSQDAFIRAFRKIRTFDPTKPFFPWFYRLLKNLCLDHLKKCARLNEVPIEGLQIPGKSSGDPDVRAIVWGGIEKLPLEQKEIIILRYFRQYSYREIAEMTGKPIGTIMSSLFYAKKKLRSLLGKPLGFGQDSNGRD